MEKIKEYIKEEKLEELNTDPNHEYLLYGVTINKENYTKLKQDYINSNDDKVFKIIGNKSYWFNSNGIFIPKEHEYFEFGMIKYKSELIIEDFIHNTKNFYNYKAIKVNNEILYLYIPKGLSNLRTGGKTYTIKPVLLINEDLYNIAAILSGEYDYVTLNDLSKFKDIIKVDDTPFMVTTENAIENKYRRNKITLEEYKKELLSLQREEKLVKTLK